MEKANRVGLTARIDAWRNRAADAIDRFGETPTGRRFFAVMDRIVVPAVGWVIAISLFIFGLVVLVVWIIAGGGWITLSISAILAVILWFYVDRPTKSKAKRPKQ